MEKQKAQLHASHHNYTGADPGFRKGGVFLAQKEQNWSVGLQKNIYFIVYPSFFFYRQRVSFISYSF